MTAEAVSLLFGGPACPLRNTSNPRSKAPSGGKPKPSCTNVAVGQHQWYHFGVGAPPILEPILVGIGMFTGGTIWVLTQPLSILNKHLGLGLHFGAMLGPMVPSRCQLALPRGSEESSQLFGRWIAIWLWVKTNGIPFWLVGEFTTHFRLPILVVGLNRMFTGG